MTPPADPRWVEVSPSLFTHETEGLRAIRDLEQLKLAELLPPDLGVNLIELWSTVHA